MDNLNIHATCIVLSDAASAFKAPKDAGVLLLGKSGSGKSDLALRLLERGAKLVADDRVELFARDGLLMARAPETLDGLIEVRGAGIIAQTALPEARIALVAEMMKTGNVPRHPQPESYSPPPELDLQASAHPPMIWLAPFEASAPAKIVIAAAAFAGQLFRETHNK
jgi:serine kinase of HPr protein (carbohydrate metabolism regulator)